MRRACWLCPVWSSGFAVAATACAVLAAVGCGDVCAVSNAEKLMNGRDFTADDSTAILEASAPVRH